MRRADAEALGIHLPVLPTIVLGGLPGDPTWAAELHAIGLDVVCSGALADTPETFAAAVAAAGGRPVKAIAGSVEDLVFAGARLIQYDGGPVPGAYVVDDHERAVAVVDGASPEIEDPNIVARWVVDAVADVPPSQLWVTCTPGLHMLPADTARAKLRALCESAFQARMAIAKIQFELE